MFCIVAKQASAKYTPEGLGQDQELAVQSGGGREDSFNLQKT